MLTCKEVARLVAQDELGASGWDRVGMRLHLLMCRFCRRYRAQLRTIGEVCREQLASAPEGLVALDRLERSILKRHSPKP